MTLRLEDKILKINQEQLDEYNYAGLRDRVSELFTWFYEPNNLGEFKDIKEAIEYAYSIKVPESIINVKVYEDGKRCAF